MKRLFTISLLSLTLSGCGSLGFLNPGTWGGDGEAEEQPAELIELTDSISIDTLWSHSVGSGADDFLVKLVPFVVGDWIFVADRKGLVQGLDRETGRPRWSRDTELEISGGPGAGSGLVLVGTADGEVVALDPETGDDKWRSRVSSEILSVPASAMGVVVVHTIDGKLFGLDSANGQIIWTYDRSAPVLTLHGESSPVIVNGVVFAGFASGKLAAVELNGGRLLWEATVRAPAGRSELERIVDIDGDPLVRGDAVFVTTFGGEMAAVSKETGIVLWRRKLSSYSGADADWRQLYVTDDEGSVWAVDPRNGAGIWKNTKLKARRLSPPAVIGSYVLVGDYEGYVHWLQQTDGKILARSRVGSDPITAAPVVVDGTAYIYGDGGALAAIRPAEPAP